MSNSIDIPDDARFRQLLMGAVDGELTSDEKIEFFRLVDHYPACQKEWENYKKLKEVTRAMKFKSPSREVWDNYWVNIYNRIERGIAWIILSIGCVILITYGLFKGIEAMLADTQLEGIVKIAIISVIAGAVILLVSVIREKLVTRKSDPYKEIQR